MKFKTRVIAGAGVVALAGGVAFVAPASASPTVIGLCSGSIQVATLTPPLGDQTAPVVAASKTAKDVTTKQAIAGSCSGLVGSGVGTVSKVGSKLSGRASCASGAAAQAADATAANAYPLNGKLGIQGLTGALSAYIATLGTNSAGPDVIDIGGIVTKGVAVGATVGGNFWEDPVKAAAKGATGTAYNTGYNLDLQDAVGCADATPNNATIATVLVGSGSSTPSLLGSTATGIVFSFGE